MTPGTFADDGTSAREGERFVDGDGDRWRIATASEDDRAALVAMYDDFDPGDRSMGLPPLDRRRVDEWVGTVLAAGRNVVATDGDRIVGHALYTPADDDEPEFAAFVHGDHQGRGVGTALGERVVADASAAHRDALTLLVDPANRAARRLYDALGFEVVERLSRERRGRRTETLRMRLELAPGVDPDSGRSPAVADD